MQESVGNNLVQDGIWETGRYYRERDDIISSCVQLGWNDEIIFPAVAAHGKARKIGEVASEHTENLSVLFWKTRILYGYELISEARSLFSTEFLICQEH